MRVWSGISALQKRKASPAQAISALAPEAQRVELSTTLNSAVSKREGRLILTFSNLPPRSPGESQSNGATLGNHRLKRIPVILKHSLHA
jgi:hypothetical protein